MTTSISTSILIPAYNEEKSIRKCVESCLLQSEKADEIIIVNDGSYSLDNDCIAPKILSVESTTNASGIRNIIEVTFDEELQTLDNGNGHEPNFNDFTAYNDSDNSLSFSEGEFNYTIDSITYSSLTKIVTITLTDTINAGDSPRLHFYPNGKTEPSSLIDLSGNYLNENDTAVTEKFIPVETPAPTIAGRSSGGGGSSCSTRWTCTEWTTCSPAGDQKRVCSYPTNFCTPVITKPVEIQTCNYVAPSTPNVNNGAGETTIPEAQTQTPTAGAGITGAVIGNLTSPRGIGMIVIVIGVLVGGFFVIRHSFRKK